MWLVSVTTYFFTDTEKTVKITEGSSHAVDSDKYAPGDSSESTSISGFTEWRAGTRLQYNCRPTHTAVQAAAYVTSSGTNLLRPMLLQLLMDVPRAHQEFENKYGMMFSNFDE
jgi:hypothetical protein